MSLTPRRNLSLKDSDFFLFIFFRCFFSIMMAEGPQLFQNSIVWLIQQIRLVKKPNYSLLMLWWCAPHLLWPQHTSTSLVLQAPARAPARALPSTPAPTPDWLLIWLALTPNSLSLYFKNPVLVQKLLTSHLEWNLVEINLSIVSRFCCNLGKLAASAFWDNVDRSTTNWTSSQVMHASTYLVKRILHYLTTSHDLAPILNMNSLKKRSVFLQSIIAVIEVTKLICSRDNVLHLFSSENFHWVAQNLNKMSWCLLACLRQSQYLPGCLSVNW